jgi:hypothetical protein
MAEVYQICNGFGNILFKTASGLQIKICLQFAVELLIS